MICARHTVFLFCASPSSSPWSCPAASVTSKWRKGMLWELLSFKQSSASAHLDWNTEPPGCLKPRQGRPLPHVDTSPAILLSLRLRKATGAHRTQSSTIQLWRFPSRLTLSGTSLYIGCHGPIDRAAMLTGQTQKVDEKSCKSSVGMYFCLYSSSVSIFNNEN